MPKEHAKNKILTWRKVIKNSVYNLCRFRMSTKKHNILKIILKILTQRKKLSTNPQGMLV